MRVLLLNPPGRFSYQRDTFCASISKGKYTLPPGDLILLSGSLDPARFEVEVLDALVERVDLGALDRRIDLDRFDAVVVQTNTISWSDDRPTLEWLAGRGPRIVVNGDHSLAHPREVLEDDSLGVDAVVSDMLAGGLGDYLASGSAAAGILRREDLAAPPNGAPRTPLRPRHELFPVHRYRVPWGVQRPVTTVYGSLGCPLSCRFCYAGTFAWRGRPLDEVMAELDALRAHGVREVVFYDSMFNGKQQQAMALCKAMETAQLDLSWSCFSHTRLVSADAADAWRAAGCHTVMLGLESGSDRLLKAMDKRQTTALVREKVALLRAHGLRAGGFFMLGYPDESDAEIESTIALATELDLSFASFMLTVPFDMTPMGKEVLGEDNSESLLGYDDGETPYPIGAGRSPERLLELRDEAVRRFYLRPGYVARRLLDLRSTTELGSLVREGFNVLKGAAARRGAAAQP